ncbi:MAG: hypothetical protein HLX50_04440 [Alteromonadaceae bacterium]|nr:hypothetical protein [Alteromonadaceae bacterium]
MNSTANERSWLFEPELLRLVHQCRRLIQSEFGVKLHLNQDDLEQQLAEYAQQTRSRHLVHTWEALKQRVPELGEDDKPVKTYRGQTIYEEQGSKSGEGKHPPRPRQNKIVYRGQVIG